MKKIYSAFMLAVLFNLSATMLLAQAGWTIYDHSNSALATSSVYKAVAVDASGNIWAGGSYSGLFKFNGTAWTEYSTFNSTILHDDINAIVIDNSNKVWAGNYKGISVYNGTTFTNYDTISAGFDGMTVYTLAKDNNGKIWIASKNGSFGYKGITTYDGSIWANLSGYPSQLVNQEFTDFAFTASNETWIGSTGIAKWNGTFSFYPKATTGLWNSDCVAIDGSGTVWAGGFDGLLKYSGSTWTFYDNVTFFGFTSNTFFYDILVDGNILWIGTAKGLLKFDRTTSSVLVNYNSTNSPLQDNCVVSIAKDASGNLWMGTTIGVVKMNPSQVGAVNELDNYPIRVYPNPCVEKIVIAQPETMELTRYAVLDMYGREITNGTLTTKETIIYTGTLPDGNYVVELRSEDGSKEAHRKIFVQN